MVCAWTSSARHSVNAIGRLPSGCGFASLQLSPLPRHCRNIVVLKRRAKQPISPRFFALPSSATTSYAPIYTSEDESDRESIVEMADDHEFLLPMELDPEAPPSTLLPSLEPPPSAVRSVKPGRRAITRKRAAAHGPVLARKAKAPAIPEDTWESVKHHVSELYVQQNQTLSRVAKAMQQVHEFKATCVSYALLPRYPGLFAR